MKQVRSWLLAPLIVWVALYYVEGLMYANLVVFNILFASLCTICTFSAVVMWWRRINPIGTRTKTMIYACCILLLAVVGTWLFGYKVPLIIAVGSMLSGIGIAFLIWRLK
jgi:hypothetical protein